MVLVTSYSRHLREATLAGAIAELEQALKLERRLRGVGDRAAGRPIAPGKWSRKEILGHLVDSAANNLQRFVRAQIPAHLEAGVLRLPGYAQDDWVRVQGYGSREWREVVLIWAALNRHVLHAMRRAAPASLQSRCIIGGGPALTLEHVLVDYVGHLKHHLAQILPPRPARSRARRGGAPKRQAKA